MSHPAWHPESLASRLPFLRRRATADRRDARLLHRSGLHGGRDAVRRRHAWRGGPSARLPNRARNRGRPPRTALAPHQPGARHEEAAGRRRGADLSAGARVAERRRQRSARPRVHHAGMVSSRCRHGLADRRDDRLSARRAAAGGDLPRRHHRPLARRAADRGRGVRPPCRCRRAGDRWGRTGARRRGRNAPARERGSGRTCSFVCCWSGSSRGLVAPIRPSSPTGPPRRPRWRAATPPIRGSPRGSSCSSAASNWPMPSSN